MKFAEKYWKIGKLISLISVTILLLGPAVTIINGWMHQETPTGPTGQALTTAFLFVAAVLFFLTIGLWVLFFISSRTKT